MTKTGLGLPANGGQAFFSSRPSLLIAGLVVFAALLLFLAASYGRMPWGTHIAGVPLGGLSLNKARERLTRETDIFLSRATRIEISGGNGTVDREIVPRELGFGVDVLRTLAQFEYTSPRSIVISAWLGVYLPPVVTLDTERFRERTRELFHGLEFEPLNARVFIGENSPAEDEIVPDKPGARADRGRLFSALIARVETGSDQPVTVPLNEVPPRIMAEDLNEPLGVWRRFIRSGSLRLESEKDSWELASTTLAKWVEFDLEDKGKDTDVQRVLVGLNQERAAPFFASLASAVKKPALNAFIEVRDGVLEESQKPRKGYRLLVDESIASATHAIRAGRHEARLVTEIVEPEITLPKIRKLGIATLMGEGESNFAGSPNNRIHNIKVGAARFRSVLIGAGEEFSFNALLGEVDGAHGYLPELVIKKNKTIPEYGGGLCQVSTTVFRSAITAGLPITERQNHSFIVSYYGKPGFDATIYPGARDFRFKNDTPGALILQMRSEGTRLIAELFGASDGRVVEVKGPVVYETKLDGSARALLTRAIERNGVRREDKFYSFYKPKALYPVERNPYE